MTTPTSLSDDPDYARATQFPGGAPSCVKSLWVDAFGGCWLESVDGQRILVPRGQRELASMEMRRKTFR